MSWKWTVALVGLLVLICAVSYFAANRAAKKETASAPTAELPPEAKLSAEAWANQLKAWQEAQGFEEKSKRDIWEEPPYKGPQTSEALMEAYDAKWRRINVGLAKDPYYSFENVKAYLERALERGAVVNNYRDYVTYAQSLLFHIKISRRHDQDIAELPPHPPGFEHIPPPPTLREDIGLPENASWEEVDNAIIDLTIRRWPTQKMWLDMSWKSEEPIVRVNLDPESGTLFSTEMDLSRLERYLITHHGIAPKGARLYYVDREDRILPPDQVHLRSWDEELAKISDASWEAEMRYFDEWTPAVAEEEQWDEYDWMVFYDEYAAMMRSIETRGKSMPTPSSDAPVPGAAPGGTPAAPSEEPVGPPEPGVHEAPPPPPRRPFETREEQAAAYEMIMDAFIESNPQLDPETRELIKRQQDAYQLWLEMRPPSAQNMGQAE